MFIVPITPMEPIGGSQGTASGSGQPAEGLPFADILQESMKNLQEAQQVSQQDAYQLATGSADDLAVISINSAKATAALELTVEVATRAVSAYKEILQMQI